MGWGPAKHLSSTLTMGKVFGFSSWESRLLLGPRIPLKGLEGENGGSIFRGLRNLKGQVYQRGTLN